MSARERPILMHARSVRGILEGRKTQTRRIVKVRGGMDFLGGRGDDRDDPVNWGYEDVDGQWWQLSADDGMGEQIPCPYGRPGDLLYVRETWRPWSWWPGEPITLEYRAGGPRLEVCGPESEDWEERMWESLDAELTAKGVPADENGIYQWEGESPLRWRPGIHLPKFGSRLWLRVTDVRVERVQDITAEDVWAEGVQIPVGEDGGGILWRMAPSNPSGKVPASYLPGPRPIDFASLTTDDVARAFWADLWDDTNGPGAWERNDWVWVVSFERTEAP